MAMVESAPIHIHQHNDSQMTMPSPQKWREFKYSDDYPRILPSPVVRTDQTSDSLRGFRIYSVLISDGHTLVAHKMMTKDKMLILAVQICEIDRVMEQLRNSPQALNLHSRCFSILPVPNEIDENEPGIKGLALTLSVTTFHFIYSVHQSGEQRKAAGA